MLNNPDDYLVDTKFQPPAHLWQKLTGLTNFWLAKWACVISIIASMFLCVVLVIITGPLKQESLIVVFLFSVEIFFSSKRVYFLEKKEKESIKSTSCVGNNIRIDEIIVRIILLCTFCVLFVELPIIMLLTEDLLLQMIVGSLFVFVMSLFMSFYFSACTSLPPSKSKTKEWYKKALNKINKKMFEREEPSGPPFWQ